MLSRVLVWRIKSGESQVVYATGYACLEISQEKPIKPY